MQLRQIIGQAAVIGMVVACGTVAVAGDAMARSRSGHGGGYAAGRGHHARDFSIAHYYGGGGLQCVPFARENTGIELAGNAANWWENAEGIYQRGARPEVGSVLNFRATGRMRMGHVAVVSNVIDGRNIEIDHANWSGRGSIGHNINVVDVSPNNDWSAVRVELGRSGEFGSTYPTYGFIYDRPDHGTMLANNGVSPMRALNTAPHDLRPAADREEIASNDQDNDEVAEAADDAQPRLRRVSLRHGSRHESVTLREAWGSRRLAPHAAREMYVSVRGGHGPAHESFVRPSLVRTQAHEIGAHEMGSGHAHHGAKRRT